MNRERKIWTLFIIFIIAIISIYFFLSLNSSSTSETLNEETVELDPKETRIQEVLDSMDDREKAGQLFLARVPTDYQIEDIQNYHLGGYLMFGRDFENETVDSVTQKISGWQSASKVPMIIASDEEGGYVTRISELLEERLKSPADLYNQGGLDLIYTDTLDKSYLMRSLGINVNLAPVADVAVNPYSFIYDRTLMLPVETSLVEAAEITADYVSTVVRAMKEAKIGCALKHFPGYGENGDTHTDIIHDYKDIEIFETVDFIPFQAGIDAGAGCVLISHNIAEAIDPSEPASISPAVHQVLREQLGFTGVILTDDLDMAGLADFTDQNSAAVQTLNAGTDLIMSSTYPTQIDSVLEALNNGTISRDRFDEAVYHVLSWKYDLGLL